MKIENARTRKQTTRTVETSSRLKTENICGRSLWMVPKSLPKTQIESTIQQRSYARTLKKTRVSEISNTRVGFHKLPLG